MSENTFSPQSRTTRHDESIDDIMASIMESVSQSNPSPFDHEHKAVVYQAEPLNYDTYVYDDKPAVILGQQASVPSYSYHESVSAPVAPQSISPHKEEVFNSFPDNPYEDEQLYSTAEMLVIHEQKTSSGVEEDHQVTTSFGTPVQQYSPELTSSIPYIPPQREGQETYQVEFDFGDSRAPFMLRSFPYLMYVLVVIALAAALMHPTLSAVITPSLRVQVLGVMLQGPDFMCAVLLVLGLVVGLIFTLASCIASKKKLASAFYGAVKTILIMLIALGVWGVVHFSETLLTII